MINLTATQWDGDLGHPKLSSNWNHQHIKFQILPTEFLHRSQGM